MELTALKKIYPRADIRERLGSIESCAVYLNKYDGSMKEWGVRPKTLSERNKQDWDSAFEAAKDDRLEDIPKHMLIRYYHAFKRINQDNPVKPVDLKTHRNYWIVGETGVGKSYYARKRWPDFFDKAPNKWFIGYKGQAAILLDDLEPTQCHYLTWYIKRWADLYSFPMETKGGGRQIRPKHLIVTSQYTIEEMKIDDKQTEAFVRRFEVIKLQHYKHRINF